MRKIFSDSQKGFTLIELLVSIIILTFLIGGSIAGYTRLDQRQTLISAGQTMKNIIRDAQSRAFSGEIDCTVCNCTGPSLTGWYVDFSTKQIYGQCGSSSFTARPFGLTSDIVITPYITPAVKLLFRDNPPTSDQKATICVSDVNMPSTYYVIYINRAGVVSDTGSLINSCVPQ